MPLGRKLVEGVAGLLGYDRQEELDKYYTAEIAPEMNKNIQAIIHPTEGTGSFDEAQLEVLKSRTKFSQHAGNPNIFDNIHDPFRETEAYLHYEQKKRNYWADSLKDNPQYEKVLGSQLGDKTPILAHNGLFYVKSPSLLHKLGDIDPRQPGPWAKSYTDEESRLAQVLGDEDVERKPFEPGFGAAGALQKIGSEGVTAEQLTPLMLSLPGTAQQQASRVATFLQRSGTSKPGKWPTYTEGYAKTAHTTARKNLDTMRSAYATFGLNPDTLTEEELDKQFGRFLNPNMGRRGGTVSKEEVPDWIKKRSNTAVLRAWQQAKRAVKQTETDLEEYWGKRPRKEQQAPQPSAFEKALSKVQPAEVRGRSISGPLNLGKTRIEEEIDPPSANLPGDLAQLLKKKPKTELTPPTGPPFPLKQTVEAQVGDKEPDITAIEGNIKRIKASLGSLETGGVLSGMEERAHARLTEEITNLETQLEKAKREPRKAKLQQPTPYVLDLVDRVELMLRVIGKQEYMREKPQRGDPDPISEIMRKYEEARKVQLSMPGETDETIYRAIEAQAADQGGATAVPSQILQDARSPAAKMPTPESQPPVKLSKPPAQVTPDQEEYEKFAAGLSEDVITENMTATGQTRERILKALFKFYLDNPDDARFSFMKK